MERIHEPAPVDLTITATARACKVSHKAVRMNVLNLVRVLTPEERILVMKKMGVIKVSIQLNLKTLPASEDYSSTAAYLGVTDNDVREACVEYEEIMDGRDIADVGHLGLKRDLIERFAKDVVRRNAQTIKESVMGQPGERIEKRDPGMIAEAVAKVPLDKPVWVLQALRAHNLETTTLPVWIAADNLLGCAVKWFSEQGAVDLVQSISGIRR